MSEVFNKENNYGIVALSMVVAFAQVYWGNADFVPLCLIWAIAGLIALVAKDIIARHRICSLSRNNAVPITWTFVAQVASSSYMFFPTETPDYANLLLLLCFLSLVWLGLTTWQQTVAPMQYVFSGVIVGVVCVFVHSALLFLLLFPIIFFCMRSWSWNNFLGLLFGLLLTLWSCYCVAFFCFGVESADAMLAGFSDLLDPIDFSHDYSIFAWIFLVVITIFILIYSLVGFSINVAKTLKAHSCVLLFSSLCLLMLVVAVFDHHHLQGHLSILSFLLALIVSSFQSYLKNPMNDWLTIGIIALFALINASPLILLAF